MPVMTDEQIRAAVADGTVFALSLDTSIFERHSLDYGGPVLRKLDQFKSSETRILISEIIASELKAHTTRLTFETQRDLKAAIRKHSHRWALAVPEDQLLAPFQLEDDAHAAAQQQVDDYLDRIGAEVLPAGAPAADTEEVLRRYFAVEAPFEDKKKHEFPDAFALVSLASAAAAERRLVLCVSADGGWRRFAESSDHLAVIADLNLALSFFNETGRSTAEQIIALLRAESVVELMSGIEAALESRIADAEFDATGWSSVDFEIDTVGASLVSVEWDTVTAPTVIAADDEGVTFTFEVRVQANFEASFHFEVRDSVDRDYISLGSEDVEKEQDIMLQVSATVSRESEPEFELYEAEVVSKRITVDFGEVEPFQSENPHYEKY